MKALILILGIALFIVACAPEAPVIPEAPEPVPPEQIEETDVDEVAAEPDPVPDQVLVDLRVPNQDVVDLSAKAEQVKGYSYVLATLPETSGENTYSVFGDNIKVELADRLNFDGWTADFVYMDLDLGSAVAYCVELSGCKDDQLTEGVLFDTYEHKLPAEWLDEVKYGEIIGQRQFNNRQVSVVQWEEDGMYYEAYLDSFYGFPQRVAIYGDGAYEEIIGGYEYQSLSFSVKAEDVELPY